MSKTTFDDDDDDAFLSLITPIQDIDLAQATRDLRADAKKPKLTLDELQSKKSKVKAQRYIEKQQQTGIVYMGRVPASIGPTRAREMLGQFGTILRVYFKPENEESAKHRKKLHRAASRRYECGWIEFTDKRHAKKCAVVLHGQPMGRTGSARNVQDDLWTLQYLSKVKWEDLRLQHQHEAEIHNTRTTQALEAGRIETAEFMKDYNKSQQQILNQTAKENAKQFKLKQKLLKEKGHDDDNGKLYGPQYDEKAIKQSQQQLNSINDTNSNLKKRKEVPIDDENNNDTIQHNNSRSKSNAISVTATSGGTDKPRTFRKLL